MFDKFTQLLNNVSDFNLWDGDYDVRYVYDTVSQGLAYASTYVNTECEAGEVMSFVLTHDIYVYPDVELWLYESQEKLILIVSQGMEVRSCFIEYLR